MDFDFASIARTLAGVSFGLIGVILAGSAIFKEQAQQYKKMMWDVILGLVLLGISSYILSSFGGG